MSDAVAKGEAAKRLLDDPILVEAFANIRNAAIRAWEQTSTQDQQAREIAWLTVKIVNRVETELQSVIDGGLIAASRVQAPIR